MIRQELKTKQRNHVLLYKINIIILVNWLSFMM